MPFMRDAPTASTSPAFPGPGFPPPKNTTQTGTTDVHHQSNPAGQGSDDQRDGNNQPPKLDTGLNFWPRPVMPSTVLGTDTGEESLFLHGWQDERGAMPRVAHNSHPGAKVISSSGVSRGASGSRE